MTDATGTLAGYRLMVQASTFTQVGGANLTLPASSLVMAMPSSLNIISGNAGLSPLLTTGTRVIDTGSPVIVATASAGKGSGVYEAVFAANALSLTVNPQTRAVDSINFAGTATPFQSTLMWSIVSGP